MHLKIDKENLIQFLRVFIRKWWINRVFVFSFIVLTFPISHLYLENQNLNARNEIIFLDVGQGDAIFIKNKDSRIGIIDTGKNLSGLMAVDKYLSLIENRLEFLIITHTDSDHAGGMNEFIRRLNPEFLFVSSEGYNFENIVNTKIIKANRDSDFNFGDFRFDFIWPDKFNQKELEDNDTSIGLIISYEGIDIFAVGDLSSEYEMLAFKNRSYNQEIEILKLSHHGSNTSSNEEFLKVINPQLAIISAGKDNSYGHPHPEILDNLNKLGIKYQRTDELGDIVIHDSLLFEKE